MCFFCVCVNLFIGGMSVQVLNLGSRIDKLDVVCSDFKTPKIQFEILNKFCKDTKKANYFVIKYSKIFNFNNKDFDIFCKL